MRNPFLTGQSYGGVKQEWVDADSRIGWVKNFTARECRDALKLPGLQRAVRLAIERRLRKLAKEAA